MVRLTLLALPLIVTASAGQPPATGKADPAFDDLEREVRWYMKLARCPAAAVAVSRDGKLLFSRGYGYRDRPPTVETPPDALFRVGSVAKPITAAVVLELIRAGKLSRDDKAFALLKLEMPPRADSRLKRITVGHLLDHEGGWDSSRSFDPVFQHRLAYRDLGLRRPATADDLLVWMLPRPLDFDPGKRKAYSNFGYCVLGRVVEKVTGKSFEEAMTESVLKPHKIDDIRAGRTLAKHRPLREVWYPVPADLLSLEVLDSCAGLTASAPALCQFMHRYWLNGERREPGSSWRWTFIGSLQGTTAVVVQRPDGVSLAALFNNRRDLDPETDQKLLVQRLTAALPRPSDR